MHVVVVGAGVNGLAAAWHLARRGARVTLLERFSLGHERGSSHGRSRITRSTYSAADYVRLARRAHREEWPRLEQDAGARLLHSTPGCFFGPEGPALDTYVAAVAAAEDAVTVLDPAAGRRRFPLFAFPDAHRVLDDRSAALVAAAATMRALAEQAVAHRAEIREETEVRSVGTDDDGVVVETARGPLRADRAVVAAGAWASRLLPGVARPLAVARQSVGYFEIDVAEAARRAPDFPVWAYLGPDTLHYYGLPEFQRPGIKAARHETAGRNDDPDVETAPDESSLAEVQAFLAAQLTVPVTGRAGAETCLYTNTPDEDFVIDLSPADPRIVVAAGFSGHGFKFGPLTGRLLAELALDGRTSVTEFEAARARFSAARA